jgi:hypothetical protein
MNVKLVLTSGQTDEGRLVLLSPSCSLHPGWAKLATTPPRRCSSCASAIFFPIGALLGLTTFVVTMVYRRARRFHEPLLPGAAA